jgi:hypothetical protein
VLTVLLLLQGIGRLVFLDWASGLAYLAGAGLSGFLLGKLMRGMEW